MLMLHMNKHTLWHTMSVRFPTLLQLNGLHVDMFPVFASGFNN